MTTTFNMGHAYLFNGTLGHMAREAGADKLTRITEAMDRLMPNRSTNTIDELADDLKQQHAARERDADNENRIRGGFAINYSKMRTAVENLADQRDYLHTLSALLKADAKACEALSQVWTDLCTKLDEVGRALKVYNAFTRISNQARHETLRSVKARLENTKQIVLNGMLQLIQSPTCTAADHVQLKRLVTEGQAALADTNNT